jgi:hypothetical protein
MEVSFNQFQRYLSDKDIKKITLLKKKRWCSKKKASLLKAIEKFVASPTEQLYSLQHYKKSL